MVATTGSYFADYWCYQYFKNMGKMNTGRALFSRSLRVQTIHERSIQRFYSIAMGI